MESPRTTIDEARRTEYDEKRIGLTQRQREIVREYKSNTAEDIAEDRDISKHTVETHIQNSRNLVNDYPEIVRTILEDIALIEDKQNFSMIERFVDNISNEFPDDEEL